MPYKTIEERRIYDKRYYRENTEKVKLKNKKSYRKNRQKRLKDTKEYYWKHKEIKKEYARRYSKTHRETINKSIRKRIKKLKWKVMTHYSGNPPKCADCGYDIYEALTIDHKNNDGNEQRKKLPRTNHLIQWLVTNNFPEGYQILCHNCNFLKWIKNK